MTATRTPVAKLSEIPAGTMKIVTVDGKGIALCNVEGKLYAIEDICTHDDGPLGEGTFDGREVECPRHGARFDVRTGAVTRAPAVVPVKTFPVKVEGDSVFVEVSHGA
jgi:3-phenylpropionate/trans-cinnamate dioxygenase ferredoxin subunit